MKNPLKSPDPLNEELRALRLKLDWHTFLDSSPKEQDRILKQLLNTGLAEDIKATVDQLVSFLWGYIELAAAADAPSAQTPRVAVDFSAQSQRLQRVVELLRLLRQPSFPDAEHTAFMARLTLAVDQHLEKARNENERSRRMA
jgi:hypothetical protein